ncbi:MAG: hypothetical protein ACPGUX_01660 [Halocynthiibacter sp.]
MKNILLPFVFLLGACGAPSEPVYETINGLEGERVTAGAMLGTAEPTPENVAIQAQRLRTGDHGAGLQKVAARRCPNGFSILKEYEPRAKIYVVSPYVQYKVYQDFVIACN